MRHFVRVATLVVGLLAVGDLRADPLDQIIQSVDPTYLSLVPVRFVREDGRTIFDSYFAAPGHFDPSVRRETAISQVRQIVYNYREIFQLPRLPDATIIEGGSIGGPKLIWECVSGRFPECQLIATIEEVGNTVKVTCGTGLSPAAERAVGGIMRNLTWRASLGAGGTLAGKIITRANPVGLAVGAAMDLAMIRTGGAVICGLIYFSQKAEAGTQPSNADTCHDQFHECRGELKKCETSWGQTHCWWDGPYTQVPQQREEYCKNQLEECLGNNATDPRNIENALNSGCHPIY